MMQVGPDLRYSEKVGAFVITEFTGKNARYEVRLHLDKNVKVAQFSDLKSARRFAEHWSEVLVRRLRGSSVVIISQPLPFRGRVK